MAFEIRTINHAHETGQEKSRKADSKLHLAAIHLAAEAKVTIQSENSINFLTLEKNCVRKLRVFVEVVCVLLAVFVENSLRFFRQVFSLLQQKIDDFIDGTKFEI